LQRMVARCGARGLVAGAPTAMLPRTGFPHPSRLPYTTSAAPSVAQLRLYMLPFYSIPTMYSVSSVPYYISTILSPILPTWWRTFVGACWVRDIQACWVWVSFSLYTYLPTSIHTVLLWDFAGMGSSLPTPCTFTFLFCFTTAACCPPTHLCATIYRSGAAEGMTRLRAWANRRVVLPSSAAYTPVWARRTWPSCLPGRGIRPCPCLRVPSFFPSLFLPPCSNFCSGERAVFATLSAVSFAQRSVISHT